MLDGVAKEVNLLLFIVTFQLVSRGTDYLSGDARPGTGAFEIDDYTPAMVWGITCLFVATVVALGMAFRNHRVVRDGAVLAMCVYLAFSVVVVDETLFGGDDWRFLTGYMAAAATWAVIAGSVTVSMAVEENRKGGRVWRRKN